MWPFLRPAWKAIADAVEHGDDERHEPDATLRVVDGWLEGAGVTRDTSRKWSRSRHLEKVGPSLVVTHGTATLRGTTKALLRGLRESERQASWHVLIDEAGGIWQSISFDHAAWHAGSESAALADIAGHLLPVNMCSVGIELINAGEVRSVGGQWRAWPFAGDAERKAGPVVPVDETVLVGGKRFHAYTPEQVAAWSRVIGALRTEWPALGTAVTIQHRDGRRVIFPATRVGHVDIDPKRKTDPYPSWAWPT
jgi:N-acetyl-anhydromuramyl-L-alanine amidase AmpD